ncbi:SLBB domain-containing protein [Synechococcus sp. CS-1332]|nr:SLBB domain-containing protein [Synechococcus sp. CS-1332]
MRKLLFARLRCCVVATVLGVHGLVPVLLPAARAQSPGVSPSSGNPLSERKSSQAPPAVPQEDAYILGPGDGLELRFLNLSTRLDRSGPIQIISDGTATVPYIGIVRLSGLTLAQASFWLQSLYRKQLLRSDLDLQLVRPRPIQVSLVGEVQRPGVYSLSTSEVSKASSDVTITGLPTLVNAIQKAGGVTGDANLREVVLRRRLPGDQVRYRRAKVDLLTLIQQGDQVQNPILFDGDIVMIPRATEPVIELGELSSTIIAPPEITVNVVGEVVRPGAVQVKPNTPLVQAVLAAGGGVVQRAKTDRVELIRINRNGTLTRMAVPLNLGAPPSPQLNPPLRDGDVVVVFRSNYARLTDAVDAIGRPLTGIASVLTLLRLADNNNN